MAIKNCSEYYIDIFYIFRYYMYFCDVKFPINTNTNPRFIYDRIYETKQFLCM